MRKQYSRWASVEEKRNVKNATKFALLTVVVLGLLFFFGITALGKFAGFVSDLGKSQKPIGKSDNTPPAPPQINSLPEFTNQTSIKLTGKSEEGATVKLTFNSNEKEVVAGKDGDFMFELGLRDGENKLDAIAIDAEGNESQRTKEFKITFDDENPDLEIESPAGGAQLFGTKQKQLEIRGKVEEGSDLSISDKFAAVSDDGSFKFTTTLNEGENKFNLKATDRAGNITEKELVVNFTP